MKEKKLIFNFFVNRNWKKLTDSRKRAKILADNREGHHPIETLLGRIPITSCAPVCFPRHNCAWLPESEVDCPATRIAHDFLNRHYKDTIRIFFSRLRRWDETKNPVTGNRLSQRSASPVPLDKGNEDSGNEIIQQLTTIAYLMRKVQKLLLTKFLKAG